MYSSTIYHSLSRDYCAKSHLPSTMSPLYAIKTIIPMGIIHLHLGEHRVFILTEGEGVRIVAELYIYVYLLWLCLRT
jgi:hypothetical protein